MTMPMRSWWLLFALVVCLAPRSSEAQLAPTGAHYAARSSDSGHAGPNGGGGYSTSVPLDLPAARGGLPVPLQIVSGSPRYGALGVGWDIPLSYVYVAYSVAHHRPDSTNTTEAGPRTRVTLSLLGRNVEMIRKDISWVGEQVWIGRNAPDLEMRSNGATWVLYDGNGLTYKFGMHSYMSRMGGPSLASGGMWLLDDITGRGGASVHLDYETRAVRIHPDEDTQDAVTINLTKIHYNPAPDAPECFKNEVSILYNASADAAHPYAVSVIGSRAVARYSNVAAIQVWSRETCDAAAVILRRYDFKYDPDADTHQDRLTSVSMTGRSDRPDGNVRIPIARFKYGSATTPGVSGPTLVFDDVASDEVPLPSASLDIGRTEKVSSSLFQSPVSWAPNAYALTQTLIDLTGDGRPDFVWYDPTDKYLHIARNIPGPGGTTTFGPPAILNDTTFTRRVLDIRTLQRDRFDKDDATHDTNHELVWTQTIDVNGDGRLDVIDAADTEGYWIAFLNTPDPTVPSGIKWERRAYYVKPVQASFGPGFGFGSDFMPLAQRTTGSDYVEQICWTFHAGQWHASGWVFPCQSIPDQPEPYVTPPIQKTVTEWELKDINGDGYPDIVRNAQAVAMRLSDETGHPSDGHDGNAYWGLRKYSMLPFAGQYDVLVALNILGQYVPKATTTDQAFATFATYASGSCGVAEWTVTDDSPVAQGLHCDLIDVNGDAIPDRVVGTRVHLGTGSGFDAGTIYFPIYYNPSDGSVAAAAFAARQVSGWTDTCKANTTFGSAQTHAVRDVTGDGIPDFITPTRIFAGTSGGFAENTPLSQHALTVLSWQEEECNGKWSRTRAGLIDIDGDGVPEILDVNNQKLRIRSLSSGESRHRVEASRLVESETGQGVVTHVLYQSAKEDATTLHQVPYPEIVVTAVTTSGGRGLSAHLATTYYAYGSISEFFDPIADSFRATGYLRRVELVQAGEINPSQRIAFPQYIATITDSYALPLITNPATLSNMSAEQRIGRYLLVGRPKEVNTLKSFASDPWLLLPLDIASATNRIAGTEYIADSSSTKIVRGVSTEKCVEMMFPYDFALSKQYNPANWNICAVGGFAYTSAVTSWRGSAAPPSANNVQTIEGIKAMDSYGRPTSVHHGGDAFRTDDDVCIETTYATPTGNNERVLSAVASRKVWNCGNKVDITYSEESFEYDHLLSGVVYSGLVTGHTIYKHATDDGAFLGAVREFDVSYDVNANPVKVTRVRSDDGAIHKVGIEYDAWGLVQTTTTTDATGATPLISTAEVDTISNEVLAVTDPNGSSAGMTYDALGRPLLSLFSGPNGVPSGATAARKYVGFEENATEPPHVIVKQFSDPVPSTEAWTTEGRVSTTFIDELGRIRYSEVALGDDYNSNIMITGARTYDRLGRVAFEADAFVLPSGQAPLVAASTSYGTTFHFDVDGSLLRMIRGRGRQPFGAPADLATETLPYAFSESYSNHTHISAAAAPESSISGSPQYGVTSVTTSTALGRTIKRETTQGGRLELAEYGYDVFAHLTRLTRYATPTTPSQPVTWTMRFDSRGELLELSEPAVAKQYRTFSDFGELKTISSGNSPPYLSRQIKNEYDGLGRLVSTAELNDGVIDPETVMKYQYDVANASPLLTPTNVVGRLTAAESPTLAVSLSYDAFGNVASRSYVDPTSTEYLEEREMHADGSLASFALRLPDNAYAVERAEYAYDSAGRPRSMWFSDGVNTQELYNATNVDAYGRVRAATFGNSNAYTADYYDSGRLLPKRAGVTTPSGTRDIAFGAFDAAGRELSRTESYNGAPPSSQLSTYDALGRIKNTTAMMNGIPGSQWSFTYDALGNTRTLQDQPGSSTKLSVSTADRDRICSVSYGGQPSLRCNVIHDDLGAVQTMPTQTGTRELTYLNSGAIKKIWDSSGAEARFSYDPFGAVSQLEINGSVSRSDRNFGPFIKKRTQRSTFGSTKVLTRTFPAPGVTISRRGPTDAWLFEVAEERGTRYTLDKDGNFIQDIAYAPFGAASSFGAFPGQPLFTSAQWNAGDALEGFGLVQVGARIYDPVIGRFLSRDPLMIPRGATTTNPYAFAWNDPMNGSDPTGLDPLSGFWGAIRATFTSASAPAQPDQADSTYLTASLVFSAAYFAFQQARFSPNPATPSAPPRVPPSVPERIALSLATSAAGGAYAKPVTAGELFGLWQDTGLLGSENLTADLNGLRNSIRNGEWWDALWNVRNFIDDVGGMYAVAGAGRIGRLLPIESELPPIAGGGLENAGAVEFYGPKSLREMAREVHGAADSPFALRRTIAIGQDAEGSLWAGSSNGFDRGQRAALERLGINRVVGSNTLHAEGELLRADKGGLFTLKSVGTWSRMPCADAGFMCAASLDARGVTVVGGSGIFPGL
jgi:RHS repeat-associated protein